MSLADTSFGWIQGRVENDIHVFRGIPFANAPTGELRWRAPQPPDSWGGVRETLEFGPCAIQSTIPGDTGELIGIHTGITSEDCLYLNVYTPGVDSRKRPVMVWIHGGGNTVGSGSQPRIFGEILARTGQIVVVTINYRLGILGFLHAPELGATGNEALLDQIAALKWVKQEIENFGGDPNNVTVFGQSAGGFDIAQLMASPLASGCFDKAIPMSGSLTPQVGVEDAYKTAEQVADRFGGFDKLRGVSASEIHAAQTKIPGARWAPTLDGQVLLDDAAVVLREGTYTRDMPLMIGHTRDESTLFTAFNRRFAELDEKGLLEMMANVFQAEPKVAFDCYVEDRTNSGLAVNPFDIWAAISTDRMFRIPAIKTAEAHSQHTPNVWMYRFDHESPAHEGRLGACHSLDIPFVWGTYESEKMRRFCGEGDHIARLSSKLMASYVSFAHVGDPNTELLERWEPYDEHRTTMCFGAECEPVDAPLEATRQLWMSP